MNDEQLADEFVAEHLRESIAFLEMQDNSLFEEGKKNLLVHAMKLTHDWFALPKDWLVTKVKT
jgi:hypothetical protein